MSKAILTISNVSMKYGKQFVLNNINLSVGKGEFISLLGPSGCGKSTLLRLVAGLERPAAGFIFKQGIDITDKTPFERNIGIIFQNYALFPNMTVYNNVAYALKSRHLPKDEIKKRTLSMLEEVGLTDQLNKKPSQLSGGQQQRVAIARTLVLRPDIILFDEPLSALDANIKVTLRKLIKDIQKKYGSTIIYVTHDVEEAFALSDRIVMMKETEIVQIDKPSTMYHHPIDDYVKNFVKDSLDNKIKSIEENINE